MSPVIDKKHIFIHHIKPPHYMKLYLFAFVSILFAHSVSASHLMGGESPGNACLRETRMPASSFLR
jgi:hypothetical protein